MKKLLISFSISILLITCKDSGTSTTPCKDCDTDTLTLAEMSKYPEYKKEYVQAMADYYWTLPKTNQNIIGVIQFSNPPARKLLKNKESLIIVVGAYLKDTLGLSKGSRAIIIGLKKNKTDIIYFDFKSLETVSASQAGGGSQVCPPPYDVPCRISFQ